MLWWPAGRAMPGGLAAGLVLLAWARWGRNRLSAAAKARIFDTTFSAMGTGADGYANPNRARLPDALRRADALARSPADRPGPPAAAR